MGFDLATAKPSGGFDLSSAKPIQEETEKATVEMLPTESPVKDVERSPLMQGVHNVTTVLKNPTAAVAEPALQIGTGLVASAVGGLAGMATAPFNRNIHDTGENIQNIQEMFTYKPKQEAGQIMSNAIAWPIEKASEGYGEIGNLLAGDLGKTIGQVGFQSAMVLSGRPWRLAPKPMGSEANLVGQLNRTVKKGMDKSKTINPTKKNSVQNVDKAYADAAQAIQSVVKRKDALTFYDEFGPVATGRVPKNLGEFAQSISQLKEVVYNKYNKMATEAEGMGAKVSLESILPELEAIATDAGMKTTSPAVTKFAKKQMKALEKQGDFTPAVAQKTIARLNKELAAYNKNPNPQLTNKMGIKAIMANHLRKNLDATIESATGKAYQPLKNEYGALNSIEKQVNMRKMRDDQAAGAGAVNFYDMISAHDVLSGAFSGNPMQLAKGGVFGIVSEGLKRAKDPNRQIKKMFKKAEKITKKMENQIPKETASAIASEVEAILQVESKGGNQLALPAPAGAMGETGVGMKAASPPTPWQMLYEIAQGQKGKQLIIERLGSQSKYAEVVADLVSIPMLNTPQVSNTEPSLNALGQ